MINRRFRKRLAVIFSTAMLAVSVSGYSLAEDLQTEAASESMSEKTDEIPETESQPPTEDTETEVPPQETEIPPAESDSEPETVPPTESETISSETESETESEITPPAESESEITTEPETEPVTETEPGSETEKEAEEKEEETEEKESEEEKVPGFSVDPNAYPPVNMTENTIEIYCYLIDEVGLNHAGACGVLANIQMESNFNQLAIGDGGTSFGICQWHLGRLSNLMGVCGSAGLDYRTLEGQLAYLEYELNSGYGNVLNYLRNVPDTAQGAYDAAYYWCMYFEMPSQTEARSVQRGNLAMYEYFPQTFRTASEKKTGCIYEASSNINVRKEPNLNAEVLEILPEGTVFEVQTQKGNWYQVSYKAGYAYVSCDYVKAVPKKKEQIQKEKTVFIKKNAQELQLDLMNQEIELFMLKQREDKK